MITRGSIIPSLTIVLLMVAPQLLRAQTIDGVVRDHETGLALAGADVVALVDGREIGLVATDSAGHFTVRTWRASTVALRVAHAGYLPADVAITIGLGERVATTVFLSRNIEVLEPLVVEGRSTPRLAEYGLSGFSERRRWGTLLGIGAYLGPDELKSAGSMGTVLARIPGIRLVDHPSCRGIKMLVAGRTTPNIRNMNRGRGRCTDLTPMEETALGICRLRFMVDGAVVTLSGQERIDDIVMASQVGGVEVYQTPSDLPAEYSGYNSRCGVVAIWTRR